MRHFILIAVAVFHYFFIMNLAHAECPSGFETILSSRLEELRKQCEDQTGYRLVGVSPKNTPNTETDSATSSLLRLCVRCNCPSAPTHAACMTNAIALKTYQGLDSRIGAMPDKQGKSEIKLGEIETKTADDETTEVPARSKKTGDAEKEVAKQPKAPEIPDSTGDESADLKLCQQAQAKASQCCGDPLACLNDAVNQGYLSSSEAAQVSQSSSKGYAYNPNASLQETCKNMQSASSDNSRANQALGGYCYQLKSSCQSTCMAMRGQHPASSSFDSSISTCKGLTARAAATGAASLNSQNSAALMAQCQQLSQAGTQSLGDMGMGDDDGGSSGSSKPTVDAIQEQNCQTHPDSESCKALRAQSLNNGVGSFVDASKNSKPNFNVGDGRADPQIPFADPNQAQNQGATVTPVPNNTGGGLPQNQAANQPRAGTNRPSPGSPGFNTDIMRGDRSGGGYSAPYVDNSAAETPDGAGVKRKYASENDPAYLKSFLPGGSRDPKFNWRPDRPLDPMALQRQQLGIYGPEVNIFEKVSQAYIRVCKEGRLFDCIDHIPTAEACTIEHNRIKELVEGRTKPAVATLPAASPGVQPVTKPAVVTQPSVKSRAPASVLPHK